MTTEQVHGLSQVLAGMLEHEFPTTCKVLAAVPEDKSNFTPNPKVKTARELMWHIAGTDVWFAQGILAGSFDNPEPPAPEGITCAGIVEWYQKTMPPLIEKLKSMTPEAAARVVNFFNVFNLPAALYLNFLNVHSIHHRGQLSTYLRCMDARVPSIYGGSADEPFEMPASAAS